MKAAEFASAVVVPFMLDDFKQFFVSHLFAGRLCSAGTEFETDWDCSHAISKAVSSISKTSKVVESRCRFFLYNVAYTPNADLEVCDIQDL